MDAAGAAHTDQPLGPAQRWAYFSGAVQWYGDLLGLAFFLLLLVGAVNLALGGGDLFRKLTAFVVATVPVLVALGLARAVALLRRGTGASWPDAIGAFLIWQSTALVVARASVQGLFARRAEFLRTPKTTDQTSWWTAIRANWAETSLAVLGLAGIVAGLTRLDTFAGPLLAGLLVFPTLGLAAAPYNSLAAQRAAVPPDLGERRRTEWLRDRRMLARGAAAVAGAGTIVGVGVVAALLLAPGSAPVSPPRLIGPAQGKPPAATTSPSGSTTPSPGPSGSGTPSGSTGPVGTTSGPAAPGPSSGLPSGSPVPSAPSGPTSAPTTAGGTPPPASAPPAGATSGP